MLKRCYIVLLILVGVTSNNALQAQPSDAGELLAYKHCMNYSVPDAPAFKLLGTDPSDILRPASVRDLAIGLSDFLGSDNSIVLPQSFAVEFSPGLLIGGKTLTLDGYRKHPALYRTRLSIATTRPRKAAAATRVAFGVRVTQIDESDLRTSTEYVDSATALAERVNDLIRKSLGRPDDSDESGVIEPLPDVKLQIEDMEQTFKERWTDKKWNARILEWAIAVRANSPDSLGRELEIDNISLWSTSGHGFGTWGQLLLALNATYEKDSLDGEHRSALSLSSRFYIGQNRYKVFIETQGSVKEDRKANWLIYGGGEVRLSGDIWADFSAGTEYARGTKKARLVTDFSLKYGL